MAPGPEVETRRWDQGAGKPRREGNHRWSDPTSPERASGLSQTSHTWEVQLLKNYEVDPVRKLPKAFAPITDRRKLQRQSLIFMIMT